MTNYAVEDIALGYAPVPPEMLFHRPKVTESAMKTWCVFALFRTLVTGESHVGAAAVAEILGVDRITVGRAIDGLVSKGFLLDLGRGRDGSSGKMLHRRFACAVEGQRLRYGRVKGLAGAHDAGLHRGGENHEAHHDASVQQPIYTEGDLREEKVTEESPSGEAEPPNTPADARTHNDNGQAPPTGGMFVRLFDEDLAGVRASYPDRARRPLSGKWRKALKRAADEELAAGRDPVEIRNGVSRLALRIDAYPGLELAEAINDVLDGKPWSVDQEARAKAALSGDVVRGEAGADHRKRGFGWLFGEGDPEPPAPEPVPDPPEPEPPAEPWEGSSFADVVPHQDWHELANGKVAAGIRGRLLEIAGEAGDAEYGAAVEELKAAPWVGDGFEASALSKAEDLRREAG